MQAENGTCPFQDFHTQLGTLEHFMHAVREYQKELSCHLIVLAQPITQNVGQVCRVALYSYRIALYFQGALFSRCFIFEVFADLDQNVKIMPSN